MGTATAYVTVFTGVYFLVTISNFFKIITTFQATKNIYQWFLCPAFKQLHVGVSAAITTGYIDHLASATWLLTYKYSNSCTRTTVHDLYI